MEKVKMKAKRAAIVARKTALNPNAEVRKRT